MTEKRKPGRPPGKTHTGLYIGMTLAEHAQFIDLVWKLRERPSTLARRILNAWMQTQGRHEAPERGESE